MKDLMTLPRVLGNILNSRYSRERVHVTGQHVP